MDKKKKRHGLKLTRSHVGKKRNAYDMVQGHRSLLISPSEADIFLAGCAHFCPITWPKRRLKCFKNAQRDACRGRARCTQG